MPTTIPALSFPRWTTALVLMAVAVTACGLGSVAGGSGESDTTAPTEGAAPTLSELADATYAGVFDEPVTLTDGRWEGEPFVGGGAARPSAGLAEDFVLTGDLNGDGRREAAVLLWENSGGSGTRSYLAVMDRVGGKVLNLGTDLIGDRVQVKTGFIADGQINLELIRAGTGDAACCPTQKALVGWRLIDGRLRETSTQITGTLSLEDLQGPDWVLAEIGWGNPVVACISHQLPAAGNDAPHPAVFSRLGVLHVLSSTRPRPSGRKPHRARHLAALATEPDEICRLGPPQVTIVFDGDRVSGNGGCNAYFGTATSEAPGKLGFSAMGTTMMVCPEPVMDLERLYLRTLAGASNYSFVAGRLVIECETEKGTAPLVFARPDATESTVNESP